MTSLYEREYEHEQNCFVRLQFIWFNLDMIILAFNSTNPLINQHQLLFAGNLTLCVASSKS
jgi:hypothetical protein